MFESMGITNQARVFQCPVCKETIDTSAQKCRFCSASIDLRAAEEAADAMAKVNQACSDASYLKIAAAALLILFLKELLNSVRQFIFHTKLETYDSTSFLGSTVTVIAILILLIVIVLAMAVRWWVKFRETTTDDSDFHRAKQAVVAVFVGVPILVLIGLIVIFSTTF